MPSWETPGACNVKLPPFNAKGDGLTDDTVAIQAALDNQTCDVVYLPKVSDKSS